MDRSLKWRTLGLLASIVLCLAVLAPTFIPDKLPSWFFFDKKINLGLDLQGGLHIVYSIDLDRAVEDRAHEIKRDLDSRFIDDKVKATVKTPREPVGAVTVILEDASKLAATKSAIQSDYQGTISMLTCPPEEAKNAICFRVASSYADGIKKSALSHAVTTIRDRIDEKGIAEPSVVEKGDEILVELPGLNKDRIQETRELISRAAKLEFKVVDNAAKYMLDLYNHVGNDDEGKPTDPAAIVEGVYADVEQWRAEEGDRTETDYFLYAHDREDTVTLEEAKRIGGECVKEEVTKKAVDGRVKCKVPGRFYLERYLAQLTAKDPKFKVPDDRQIGYEENEPPPQAKDKRVFWRTYYLDRAVRLTGSAIKDAMGSYDQNTNRPIVLLDFNRYGSRVFGDLTAQIVGKKLATILDDRVKSAPTINGAIRGGRASITMGGNDATRQERERDELVNVLKTGSLPAPLKEESASEVGPTLGMDAIAKTRLSFALGVVLVIIIMVGIYRWSGWIAVFGVLYHILLTIAVMAAFGATLTLPGIAAVVLSVGMTVDGNILIYERIRDELLLGKSVRGAIDLGFSRAFSAILDGQLTTAAAGWVLLQYGSGPIKGFAVMLLVGVFTTLTTNIWITRIFFDWYVSRKKGVGATISI
ncbi:MAG TPA: protein translocase subunit SecD [Kofleriaceae bacterium]|jgi:preprotein translocase subunit SecD|nr:protein translocase subunit SecD [Kofleriaceae bacterium]